MNFGFDQYHQFYYEYPCITREVGNMRQETERRVVELYSQNKKLALSLSSGLDSQSILHSFACQGIPYEAFFMLLPNHNNYEYQNLKILEKKYGFKANVIRIDPIAEREDIEEQAQIFDCHPLAILHKKFLQYIPDEYDFIQNVHDPFIFISEPGQYWYVQSYYDMETSKMRVFDSLNRKGKNVMFGNTSEFLLSIIDDSIFQAAIASHRYYDTNGLHKDGVHLKTVDRYDYYIKPLLYGKYWGEDLIYFGKYVGDEEVKYIRNAEVDFTKKGIVINYIKFRSDLQSNKETIRYYHNMPKYAML